MTQMIEFFYIDMRRSKGYTEELEKLNYHNSGLAVTIGLKEAAAKAAAWSYWKRLYWELY